LLEKIANLDISDPYGSGLEAHEVCAKQIKLTLTKTLDKIVNYMLEKEERKKISKLFE